MKIKITTLAVSPIALALIIGSGVVHAADTLSPIEQLGERIFHDINLSENKNQACVSCHAPEAGWTSPDSFTNEHGGVVEGSNGGEFGNRKPPSSAYATFAPRFYADYGNRLVGQSNNNQADNQPVFFGGNFWDGRATGWKLGNPAADQSQGPFINPVEHALPNPACAVQTVCNSNYSDMFNYIWTPKFCMTINQLPVDFCAVENLKDIDPPIPDPIHKLIPQAYDRIALSISAFESSTASNAFTSKVDAFRASRGTLAEWTAQEERGRIIFRDEAKCISCHTGDRGPGGANPLLTNFGYNNLGVPGNPENPVLANDPSWQDPGLAGFLETIPALRSYADSNLGKVKVPTLRNVALGSCEAMSGKKNNGSDKGKGDKDGHTSNCIKKAYMHNGYFKSLKSVVHFYNTRNSKPVCEELRPPVFDATEEEALANDCWPQPEVEANVEKNIMGGLEVELSEADEAALVAFMQALSDGYEVPVAEE